jgi:hypothetical protein
VELRGLEPLTPSLPEHKVERRRAAGAPTVTSYVSHVASPRVELPSVACRDETHALRHKRTLGMWVVRWLVAVCSVQSIVVAESPEW